VWVRDAAGFGVILTGCSASSKNRPQSVPLQCAVCPGFPQECSLWTLMMAGPRGCLGPLHWQSWEQESCELLALGACRRLRDAPSASLPAPTRGCFPGHRASTSPPCPRPTLSPPVGPGCCQCQPRCHSSLTSLPEAPYRHWAAADHLACAGTPNHHRASPACSKCPSIPVCGQQLWGEPASSSAAWQEPCPKPPSPWWDEGAASSSSSRFLARTVMLGQLVGQTGDSSVAP